jgi:phytoene dehydrogenase-like protein
VSATAAGLGDDEPAYRRLIGPFADVADAIIAGSLGPLLRIPRHPLAMARFGLSALMPASRFASRFGTDRARALIAGLAAHSVLPLDHLATNGVGLALALAGHRNGWPIAAGGSRAITDAMAAYLETLGGEIRTGWWVRSLDELPPADAVLLDVTPAQLVAMADDRLGGLFGRRMRRWRYGPASFKVDYATSAPIPWSDPAVARTGTVHVGGSFEDIAASERAAWEGRAPHLPFVLLTQPTLFDPDRAPEGKHVVWAYCHVPEGWEGDATEAIDAQIERFAPGFRDTVLARHTMGPAAYEAYNPNNVNGTIAGGAVTLSQLVARPRLSPNPYATPFDGLYLCSSATAPGAGTHGMCGFHAARAALSDVFGVRRPSLVGSTS